MRFPKIKVSSLSVSILLLILLLTPVDKIMTQEKPMKKEMPYVVSKDDSFLKLSTDLQDKLIKNTKKIIHEKLTDLESKSSKIMIKMSTSCDSKKEEGLIECEAVITFLFKMTYTAHLSHIKFTYIKDKIEHVKVTHDYKPEQTPCEKQQP